MTNTPDQTVQNLALFEFCALVALHTAVQQGNTCFRPLAGESAKTETVYRSVALDIKQLLDKGRKLGVKANASSTSDSPAPANSNTKTTCS
ncbi:hypothetical protein A9Q62_14485 [Yersinia ruckeri]|uniref:hypothetical protein n=1 Tax=Yersinia ruckeri TaxID=29486 RepID=UPI000537B91C|nr:hypothetical protein [Yersinia ruckeri]AUQ41079.1 hypothetical protein NJ56_03535 [Yersinia ruckeri]OJB84722.1 hypothetical protein A9Q62_14485 [Yersinia ruckeri]OJB91145.1 hypothetical protein A9Q60_14115 [Yersinia ruckeri]